MTLSPGSRLGPYEVVERLGAGGMGEVYRAKDTRLGREVALKVLPPDASRDDERLRRFVSEAKHVSALNHPNILTLHEIGEGPNGPYLVTEIVDGETIRARLDQAPIAFRLLPPTFTLSELQQTYELLLGRRLHKASFRRALQAAWLVEPTDEWRSEGRGRPAQLFRYAPRRRRNQRRGVRFDLLAGRAAGTATVYVDTERQFPFREHADVAVDSLVALAELLG